MRHPFLIALAAGAIALVLAFVPTVWHMVVRPPAAVAPPPTPGTPWQVEPLPGGASQVFGLRLPGSTLADARQRWGDDLQVAVMAAAAQPASLEAYVERFSAGGIDGRLVLVFDAEPAELARWQAADHRQPINGGGWRHPVPVTEGGTALLVGLNFIPAARLDADMLRERFGPPAERLPEGERLQHWLYPERGLAVLLDRDGKDVLQYVAPVDFERRLRAPLVAR